MKRCEQKAKTRRGIRSAFIELLQEKPLSEITVKEIAEKADIDRKTFYLHYDTIYDVYYEIEEEIISGLRELLDKEESKDWKDFLTGLTEIMEANLGFYVAMVRKDDLAFLIKECTSILTERMREALLPQARNKEEADTLIRYASSGILGVYQEWLLSEERMPLVDLIQILSKAMDKTLKDL